MERIGGLAIPPAWEDVWICRDAQGHIQATGVDAAGRKQYLYHEAWRRHRDREKFNRMLELAESMPSLRRAVKRRLGKRGLKRDQVLAGAIRMLDLGLFRVGNERYADDNDSFGLATLRRSHVRRVDGALLFDYPAKSSQRRVHEVRDPQLTKLVGSLKRRKGGGRELLAYRADDGGWTDVRSEDINAELKELTGAELSAKDFRTWNATVLAATLLAGRAQEGATKTSRQRISREVVKSVAEVLGNTPAVCRRSYIDPRLFDRFDAGKTIEAGEVPDARHVNDGRREQIEAAVIELLS